MDASAWTKEDLLKILHNADTGLLVSVPDEDRFVEVNTPVLSNLGYTREEFLSRPLSDLFDTLPLEKQERILYKKNGEELLVEAVSRSLTLSDGRLYTLTTVKDMTKNREIKYRLKHKDQQFKSLYLYNPDTIFSLDMNGRYTNINPSGVELFGYAPEKINGSSYLEFLTKEAGEATLSHFKKVTNGETVRFETTLISRDEARHIMDVTAVPLIIDNVITGVIGIARDMTVKKATERLLTESEQRYRSLFDYNTDAVMTFDTDGTFTHANASTEKLSGMSIEQLRGKSFLPFISEEVREETRRHFFTSLQGQPHQYETQLTMSEGEKLYLHVALVPIYIDGNITGIHCVAKNVTELKKLNKKMNHLAYHDTLTGLPNQRYFHETIEQKLASGENFALFFLDLDRFKFINDYMGHHMGDELLKQVSRRLLRLVGPRGNVFRYGGDEFLIILPQVDTEEAGEIAADITSEMERSYDLNGYEALATVSIGISMSPKHSNTTAALIRQADNAMYHAKNLGKNTWQVYNSQVQKRKTDLKTESHLYKALANREFFLVYQPQFEKDSSHLIGIEALLRWRNKDLGLVSPSEFITIAEETGLIVPIGEWAIREACQQAKAWQNEGHPPVKISVNLSMRQFYHNDLVEMVAQILRETGLPAKYLELEITESMAIHAEEATDILNRLSGLGVKISIDDFGTGYSSLSYLKRFPIHQLKIDKSFIKDIGIDRENNDIITTIISLADSLNLEVIAEGVETASQLDFLRRSGCDKYQGYYFAKPMKPEQIASHFNPKLFHK
ncbi:sensor domain-containing protein [Salimicrobium album]|uniref:PAS domain S-box-containing protein/diguanylate cyclase (GGDEF) domain-containing protein n=1 Tax=Salimicrobium album TaxID=50717 RepID=A0A1H3FV97_9BACI|nr:bifunctional diguanylate cyclase/phosphodiesterase [Salimicrobium album]SDX94755.1 PAS domain S-box-containing protein/diguanylate cyclase (GGDEF) domain-containing protein [Salimicrobium album]